MSSEENEFSQIDGTFNDETFVAPPPPYTESLDLPVITSAAVSTDTPPTSAPRAYSPAPNPTYPTTSIGQPTIFHQPQVTPQSAYHPTIAAAAAGATPIFHQYPGQAPYPGPASGNFATPVNAQPIGISLQPIQIIQHQHSVEVPNEMFCSVISTLCCCLCLGIPAMILASQANSMKYTYPQRALSKARTARSLNNTSFTLGIALIIAVIVYRYSGPGRKYY